MADDRVLQDHPLQIRVMDHDTYSANDAIGKVYVDLNPLLLNPTSPPAGAAASDDLGVHYQPGELLNDSRWKPVEPRSVPTGGGAVMCGWLPIYDTLHGVRGEVNLMVKVELFSDHNRYRQSSCGVQFFCSESITMETIQCPERNVQAPGYPRATAPRPSTASSRS